MATNPIDEVFCEREDPVGSGTGWTTAALAFLPRTQPLKIRGRFTTDNIGGVEKNAAMLFQRRLTGSGDPWFTMQTLGITVKDTNYEFTFNPGGILTGAWELRILLIHETCSPPIVNCDSNVVLITQIGSVGLEDSPPAGTSTEEEADQLSSFEESQADTLSSWEEEQTVGSGGTEELRPAGPVAEEEVQP